MASLSTVVADIIMSRAYFCGREGDYVTAEDRDSAAYLDCQNAAADILSILNLNVESIFSVVESHIGSEYAHTLDAAERILQTVFSHALSDES